jgi:EmrB/QacA subfamily drug resistance transporter
MAEPAPRRLALLVICAATLMTIVDETIATVAVPSIQRDLGFDATSLTWVVNAYLVGFGGFLLLAGRLGDLVGRGRMLLGGMALFTVASLACGLAPGPVWLVGARFVQGVGGALATAVALGMIAALYPDAGGRGRAMGTYAFMGAVGASTGLVLGGLITSALDWRWAFFVNVPIGLLVVAVGLRVLPREAAPGIDRTVDWVGAALLIVGLMALVTTIVAMSWPMGVAAGVLLAAFVVRQARASDPILPLGALRSRLLVGANLAHACFVGAMFTFQFLVTLYLQQVLGFSPAQAGLGIVPIAAGIAVVATLVHPRVSGRFGLRPTLVVGLVLVVAGLALLGRVSAESGYWSGLFPSVLLFAVGGGLTLPSMMVVAMSAATPRTMGLTSGLLNTSQQVGGALGLAALSAVAATTTADALAAGAAPGPALVAGYALAWTLGAGLAGVSLLLVLFLRLRPAAPAPSSPASAQEAERPCPAH